MPLQTSKLHYPFAFTCRNLLFYIHTMLRSLITLAVLSAWPWLSTAGASLSAHELTRRGHPDQSPTLADHYAASFDSPTHRESAHRQTTNHASHASPPDQHVDAVLALHREEHRLWREMTSLRGHDLNDMWIFKKQRLRPAQIQLREAYQALGSPAAAEAMRGRVLALARQRAGREHRPAGFERDATYQAELEASIQRMPPRGKEAGFPNLEEYLSAKVPHDRALGSVRR